MGIFCMVFGVIVFGGFVAFGAMFPHLEVSFYSGGPLVQFLNMPTNPLPYIVFFGYIGLMIGLSFFMKGLTYHRLGRLERKLRDR